ncbi:DUF3488 and transglutaminase-like domain-containing protein [Cryobacterium sp. BB307]|uniref:transglutaminase TgpA family protein n=1 Tax=Cryobacterium sp. BB307 TaxID=2716317 RepID=UPI001446D814|nr:DUF3488 and transglutaminase-like domain-containing protein [Cryobacterium sp. BB307]
MPGMVWAVRMRDLLKRDLLNTVRWERTGWRTSGILLVAFAVTLGGLHTMLEGVGWWLWCMVLVVVVLGSGVAARWAGLGRWSPLVSTLALAATIVTRFAADTAWLGVIPTGDTILRFRTLLVDATYSITWQSTPANADVPIQFVMALGIGPLVLIAEALAFSVRLPALTGIPLVAVFLVPGLTPDAETSGLAFIGTAASYLWLLMSTQRSLGSYRGLAPALAIGSIAVIGGLVLPAALPSTEQGITASEAGPSVVTGVNPIVRLGEDLRRTDDRPVLSYTTASNKPYYLRLTTISDFSQDGWGPEQPVLDRSNRPHTIPRPSGLQADVRVREEVGFISVGNLASPWLPVPYPISSVTQLNGDWLWDKDTLTVASNTDLAIGENFTVRSHVIEPTPEQLQRAGTTVPDGVEDYLELPAVPAIIADTAREATAGVDTNYEKAVALQQYLRSALFRYSEQTPVAEGYDGTGVDMVGVFLERRAGYCIHFASAMATMARTLGIPSRMVIGFQQGSSTNSPGDSKIFEVTTDDLHSWPELYFEGIGWVAFEPTQSRGRLPDYANPGIAGVPAAIGGAISGNAGAPRDDSGLDGPAAPSGSQGSGWFVSGQWRLLLPIAGAVLLVIVLSLLPAGVRMLRHRRNVAGLRSGRGSAMLAWRELRATATDVGLALRRTETPRETVERLRRARGMTQSGRDAVSRIGAAVERERFGRPSELADSGSLADDVAVATACLRSGIAGPERLRATLWPNSLVNRNGRLAARTG